MSAPAQSPERPIKEAFRSVGSTLALLGSVVTGLVGWGVLTGVEGDAITGLLGVIPGVVTAVTVLGTAFGVLRKAEPQTTPTADPAVLAEDGVTRIPLVPAV